MAKRPKFVFDEGEPNVPRGWGATEARAIADLEDQTEGSDGRLSILTAAEAVVKLIRTGKSVHPGSYEACDLEDALCRAKGLPEPYRTGQDGPMPF